MKLPSIFSCCRLEHNQGETSIKVKSSCFDRPVVINIGSNIDANELIIDFIKKLSAKPKKEPQTEQLNSDLEVSLNEV